MYNIHRIPATTAYITCKLAYKFTTLFYRTLEIACRPPEHLTALLSGRAGCGVLIIKWNKMAAQVPLKSITQTQWGECCRFAGVWVYPIRDPDHKQRRPLCLSIRQNEIAQRVAIAQSRFVEYTTKRQRATKSRVPVSAASVPRETVLKYWHTVQFAPRDWNADAFLSDVRPDMKSERERVRDFWVLSCLLSPARNLDD